MRGRRCIFVCRATRAMRAARPQRSRLARDPAPSVLLFNAHHDPSEDYTRISIWQAAMQIIDRFPLTGVGPFNFSRLYALVTRLPTAMPTCLPRAQHLSDVLCRVRHHRRLRGRMDVCGDSRPRLRAARRRPLRTGARCVAFGAAAGLVGVAVQGLIDTVSVGNFRALDAHDGARARGGARQRRPAVDGRAKVRTARARGAGVARRLQSAGRQRAHAIRRTLSPPPARGDAPGTSYYGAGNAGPSGARPPGKSTTASITICWQARTRARGPRGIRARVFTNARMMFHDTNGSNIARDRRRKPLSIRRATR